MPQLLPFSEDGLPQALSDDLINESEILKRPTVMDDVLGASEGLFVGTDANPFMATMAGVNKAGHGNAQTTTSTIDSLL